MSTSSESETITVLLAEDSPDDVLLTSRALKRSGIEVRLVVCSDGEHARDYLAGHGIYADRKLYPLPALLLLDWKLPRRTGAELLQWLKQEPALSTLPAVVLSASGLQEDKSHARALGAVGYLQKPLDASAVRELFARLHLHSPS